MKKVYADVPEGFIDEHLLFNFFISDYWFCLTDTFFSIYAHDNNLYSIEKDHDITKELLRKDFNSKRF